MFFSAVDGTHDGREPWRSDGTEAGTTLAADIVPGARSGGLVPGSVTQVRRKHRLPSGLRSDAWLRALGLPQDTAPSVTIDPVGPAAEGTDFAASGSFSDPDTPSFTATVDFGDGTGDQALLLNPDGTFDLFHTFADNGSYTITVAVRDDFGARRRGRTGRRREPPPLRDVRERRDGRRGAIRDDLLHRRVRTVPSDLAAGLVFSYDLDGDGVYEIAGVADASRQVTFGDNGTYLVRGRVQDKDGGASDYQTWVTVTNVAPTADAGPDLIVDEGMRSPCPAAPSTRGRTRGWPSSGTAVGRRGQTASGTGTTFTFTPGDDDIYTVTLTVTDKDGGIGTDSAIVTARGVGPGASLSGPASAVRGQYLTYTLAATDPSSADQAGGFTYRIDWDGNGSVDQTISGPATTTVAHVFPANGTFTPRVSTTDKDGVQGAASPAARATSVSTALLVPDPFTPGTTDLLIGGTTSGDTIAISQPRRTNNLSVSINRVTVGTFSPPSGTTWGRIVVYGQAGDDSIQVASGIATASWLFGDDGNDTLVGGAAATCSSGAPGTTRSPGTSAATSPSAATVPTRSTAMATTTS